MKPLTLGFSARREQLGHDIGASWREGTVNWNFNQELREQHRRGKRDNSCQLFAIFVFNAGRRRHIQGTLAMSRWQPSEALQCAS